MDASTIFENLVHQIQSSHLNFKLELSPFSAKICLKKSFIRNQAGIPLPPRSSEFYHCEENVVIEDSVAENYENNIRLLEDQVRQVKSENETITFNYDEEIVEFEAVSNKLKDTFERLDNIQNSFSKL